jgi:hypothetical protein
MGIAIFLVIAFVMLGVERLVSHMRTHHHPARHGVTPRS